jgi:hypothetical protein
MSSREVPVRSSPDGGWKRQAASSRCSHSIEVFAELRDSWTTRDLSSTHLINVDFIATRDFYFD